MSQKTKRIPVYNRCIQYQTMHCNPDACNVYKNCRDLKMRDVFVFMALYGGRFDEFDEPGVI